MVYRPLPVVLVTVEIHARAHVGDVHLDGVIRPGAEHESTALLVEGVVSDVNLTARLEDAARLPVHRAVARHYRPEVAVVSVDALRSRRNRNSRETGLFCTAKRHHHLQLLNVSCFK